ncbi:mammalian cell entry [Chlorella sorokiniana]|uniref:Mammalian cell entry n=1 Tax=Chlorella sorokiniana TaxID=3076 RepID=A0A2P6TNR9_CHLSO|nr:mammalian cell entry [Chlorella sorokiniana]|eukprot:PRW50963.1 mammalian cell entry [Chlorella sorokiniana]
MAFLIAKEAGRLPPDQCRAALATLQPKFQAYQQRDKEEDTGRLVAVLQSEVGMSTEQLLQFALGGGLRGDQAARTSSLDIALARLKRLLLVCGSWQGVAAALERCPGLLFADDAAVEELLPEQAQRAMWQVVAQMQAGS